MTNPKPNVSRVYQRIGRAFFRGTGVRLSPAAVRALVLGDNAVETALLEYCGRRDVAELERLGPADEGDEE